MSLLYDANGDKFESTSNVSVPTAGMTTTWFYSSSDAARQTIYSYDGDGLGTSYLEMAWRADLAGDYFFAERERGGGATSILMQADAANFAVYGLNKWLCLICRWDTAGANADQSIWLGDLTTPPSGPSSYTTQTVGSGTAGTTAGVVTVGNSRLTTTRWVQGRVGFHALFPTRPSDADVERVWRGYFVGNPTVWWAPGANGTTDVPERSAGNLGVITALSSPDAEPRRIFPPPWWAYHQMQMQGRP